MSGRSRLGGVDAFEELVEDPHERLVVLGAEHLGDEGAALHQELGGELEGVEREEGLLVGVVGPALAHVGGAVVENDVAFPALRMN